MSPKSVLITGSSDGGLGAALAFAFKDAGYRVIATARNLDKLAKVKSHGIEVVQLDVLSEESVRKSVKEVEKLLDGGLDILINNAGAGYSMPVTDIKLDAIRNLFELNVFSLITVSREYLALLRKSPHPVIVNNTSVASVLGIPFQAAYNASKAAAASLTNTLRLELEPFGVKVIDMKTGAVQSNFFENSPNMGTAPLPEDSLYQLGRDVIENTMTGVIFTDGAVPASGWARQVVKDLSRTNPAVVIWRGGSAALVRLASFIPITWLDGQFKEMSGVAEFEKRLKKQTSGIKGD